MSCRSFDGMKMLIIEDSPDGLFLLQNLFRAATCISANDGESGLELALSLNPDVVLLDLQLPQLDGFEVLRRLRSAGKEMPIIVVSAMAFKTDKERAIALGATHFFSKPYWPWQLIGAVLEATGRGE